MTMAKLFKQGTWTTTDMEDNGGGQQWTWRSEVINKMSNVVDNEEGRGQQQRRKQLEPQQTLQHQQEGIETHQFQVLNTYIHKMYM